MLAEHTAEPSIRRLRGVDAFESVRSSIYRPWAGRDIRDSAATTRFCAELVERIPVFRFERRRDFGRMGDCLRPLEELFHR